jgi:multidrug efflux pump subunit AcrA (membrane-fusion protein)
VSRPAEVDPGTAAAPVRLAFVRPAPIPAGTPVQVDIDAEEHRGVVIVPVSAIVHEGNETAVFVVADNKAHRRVVETGLADDEHVEVKSGLKVGEVVITHGQSGLPDGATISVSKPQ